MKRRISDWDGMLSLKAYLSAPEAVSRSVMLTAVRYALEELGSLHPGRSVEFRVPPAGAVQIIQGSTHRRGTPPAVVETDMDTFLRLAAGSLSWEQACQNGVVSASGERTDLTNLFPIFDSLS